jgi:hypothetical protein
MGITLAGECRRLNEEINMMEKFKTELSELRAQISLLGTRNELHHGITHGQINDVATSIQCETENK